MFTVAAYAYEFLTEFLPFLLVFWLLRRGREVKRQACDVLMVLFALYVMCVFHVTGAGTLYEALNRDFQGFGDRVNWIPFSQKIDIVGYALNVVMSVPFGFLMPLLRRRDARSVAWSGLTFSVLIELSQLLSSRGTDVDDLIMNTLGALTGFLIYKVWDKATKSRFQQNTARGEAAVTILVMYLGRCLLFNYLGLICLWYGY